MAKRSHLIGRLRSQRGWRRRIAAVGVLLLAVLIAGGVYLTRPARLAGLAADLLQRITGAEVRIDQAHLSLIGEIELDRVDMRVPNLAGDAGRLFDAQRVVIRPDLASLVTGNFNAKSIVFLRPTLHITEDLDATERRYNFQRLFTDDTGEPLVLPETLPAIFLRQGAIEFNEVRDGEFKLLSRRRLDGRLTDSARDPYSYSFALQEQAEDGSAAPSLTGAFSLRNHSIEVVLENVALDQPQRHFIPGQLRKMWDQFHPEGELTQFRFAYAPDGGLSAELELESGKMTVPIGEEEDYGRMTDVSVRFEVKDEVVRLTKLKGQIEGIRYQMSGKWLGFDQHAPFTLSVYTDPFRIAEEPRFVFGIPRFQENYERFNAAGLFKAEASIQRASRGGEIDFRGQVELIDVQATYSEFDYPLETITGSIVFTNNGVRLDNLQGVGPTGANVTIVGTINPLGNAAEVDLRVIAEDLPIDDALRHALDPGELQAMELMLDPAGHRRLIEAGLIRSDDPMLKPLMPATSPVASPPLFELGGSVGVTVRLYRPAGEDQRYETKLELEVAGVNALFKHWTYPVEIHTGRIFTERDRVRIVDLQMRGPTGARAALNGEVLFDEATGIITPKLRLEQGRIPFDAYLNQAIAPPHNLILEDLAMRGEARFTGDIYRADDAILYTIDCDVSGATATPYGGDVVVTDILGRMRLEPTRIQLPEITGDYAGSPIALAGVADWGTDDPELRLRLRAEDMLLKRELVEILPVRPALKRKMLGLFDDREPEAIVDADLRYHRTLDDAADETYQLTLEPDRIALNHGDTRVQLTDITGQLLVHPTLIELNTLTARTATGRVGVNGFIQPGTGGGAAVSFKAESDSIDATTRALLPTFANDLIDQLAIDGAYRLVEGRWLSRPSVKQGPVEELEARVELDRGEAFVGVPITELDGVADLRVVRYAGQEWPYVEFTLDADELRAADRLIAPFDMKLETGERANTLELSELNGRIYGGIILGGGRVRMGERGGYEFELKIHDADVDATLYPRQTLTAAQTARVDPDEQTAIKDRASGTGNLSASLGIEADLADPRSRRGRGVLSISDAKLFRSRVALALLQAGNFNLPTANSFDRASARFVIEGDAVLFDEVRMESPSFALIGDGWMDLPTQRLDLRMSTRDTGGFRLGPVSDLIDVFKDELVSIQVTGTLEEPNARAVPLIGLRRSWQSLLEQAQRSRSQSRAPTP